MWLFWVYNCTLEPVGDVVMGVGIPFGHVQWMMCHEHFFRLSAPPEKKQQAFPLLCDLLESGEDIVEGFCGVVFCEAE